MRTLWLVPLAALSLSSAACSDPLNEEDTRVAWASTNLALAQGQAQAQASASGAPLAPSGQTDEIRPRVAAQVDYTWSCTGGGSAQFVGSAETIADASGSSVTFDLQTDFSACSVNDVAISGELDYSGSVDASAGSASTTLSMKGSLSFEGKIEGDCKIDMTSAVSASTGSASVSYEGSICGHSAKAALNVQG